jgi:outer membrane protein OmpA-like peptidoglycan-associated protein
MRVVRLTGIGTVAVAATFASACGPRRVAQPSQPAPELVVLLADPETGAPGHARVTSSSATVDLVDERSATRVVASKPPTPAFTMDEAEVRRVFGDALAAVPPTPRIFNLYFRFDSDELTDEANKSLPEILRTVKEWVVPDVVAIGHTDTTGLPEANFTLGLKRATRVRDLLVKAGLDPSLIEVSSLGESDPLIPTPDETPEPRNRRVEIAVR